MISLPTSSRRPGSHGRFTPPCTDWIPSSPHSFSLASTASMFSPFSPGSIGPMTVFSISA